MLSGYWVTRLCERRVDSVLAYLVDRWLRIWPMLAVVAIAWLFIGPQIGIPITDSLVSTLALLGLASRGDDVVDVAWSLDLELQFYIALPLILWAVSALPAARRRAVMAIGVAAATLIGAALLELGAFTALVFAPSFAAGIWIYRTRWSPSGWLPVAGLVVFIGLGTILAAWPPTTHAIFKPSPTGIFDTVQTVWTLGLVPVVAWNVAQPSSSIDRTPGNLSFPALFGPRPVTAMVFIAADGSRNGSTKLAAFAAAAIVTVLIYAGIDRPIERWRVAMRGRRALEAVE